MNDKEKLAFGKSNYMLMVAGVVTLVIGFYIMTLDKDDYGFGFMGLTLGPIVVMIGFVVEFFAILHKPKTK